MRRTTIVLTSLEVRRRLLTGLTVVLVVLQFCGSLWARPTTADEAEKVVTGWLKADAQPLGTTLGRGVIRVETFTDDYGEGSPKAGSQPIYYVVYLQPSGFVIVPADDLVEPIIGFADDGTFEPSLESPLGALVTNDLNGRITAVRNSFGLQMETPGGPRGKWRHFINLAEASENSFGLLGLTSIPDVRVDPFVKSKWGQSDICGKNGYNYYTPNNYYCGCVATAMAQLMRYHEYPDTSVGIGRKRFRITVDDTSEYVYTRGGDGNGGPYQWSLMVLDPNCRTTLEQRQAIGALCYDAGAAVKTEYSGSGSASNLRNARNALLGTFNYSSAICALDSDGDIGGGVLNNMVNANLDAGNPVILGIIKEGAEAGHAVIADGYGYDFSTLYHHLNMGWGGSNDIWYNLPDVDYSRSNQYNAINGCIYNIFTFGSGEIISGRITDLSGSPVSGATVIARNGRTPYTAVTNDKGIYALAKVHSYSTYTVSVIKFGYGFTPQSVTTGKSVDSRNVSGNKWGIDFVVDDTAPLTSDYSTEDFETGDFSKFPWATSGADNWKVTSLEQYSGTCGAETGKINDNESTTLLVRLDCASGDIVFYRKVSSEYGYDYLKFYIDGAEKDRWSGTKDWAIVSFPVTAGIRTFEWTYSKDGFAFKGSDTAWIDDIVFPIDCGTLCDFDGDNEVNFCDFAVLASQWMGPRKAGTLQRGTSYSADLNGDGCVDFKDLEIFAGNWLVDLTPWTTGQ